MVTQLHDTAATSQIWEKSIISEPHWFPFYTYEWQNAWSQLRDPSWSPLFLHVNSGTGVVAPFERNGSTIRFSGGEEISDYMDLVGDPKDKIAAWKELFSHLKSLGISTLQLRNIPEFSPTYTFFKDHARQEDTTPRFPLPKTWEEYLAQLNKDQRHEIRRKFRRFEDMFNDVAMHISTDLATDMHELIALMKFNEHKSLFLTSKMERFFEKLPVMFPKQTTIYTLSVEGKTVSAALGFTNSIGLYLYNSGYDDVHFPGAGFYLAASTIRLAIKSGLTEYNFLQGSERYKYDLGAKDAFVYKAHLSL